MVAFGEDKEGTALALFSRIDQVHVHLGAFEAAFYALQLRLELTKDVLNGLALLLEPSRRSEQRQLFLLDLESDGVTNAAQLLLEADVVSLGLLRLVGEQSELLRE